MTASPAHTQGPPSQRICGERGLATRHSSRARTRLPPGKLLSPVPVQTRPLRGTGNAARRSRSPGELTTRPPSGPVLTLLPGLALPRRGARLTDRVSAASLALDVDPPAQQ